MSEVRSDVDLSKLSRRRAAPEVQRPRRSPLRWLLPLAIVGGFAGLLVWSLGDALRPRVEVELVRPKSATRSSASGGTVAFAAAGWVEPDPFPLHVTPLTEGVIEEILVEEGDRVTKDQAIARLVPDDAMLEQRAAQRSLEVARATVKEREVELTFAQREFDARIELDEKLKVAAAEVVGKKGERDALVAAAARLAADVEIAREELDVQRELREKGAGGPRQVELAAARLESARSAQLAANARAAHATAQVDVAEARLERARRDADTRFEEKRRIEAAKTALDTARHTLAHAETQLAIADLRVARLVVRTPRDGIVLERHIAPGASVTDGGVLSIYDPKKLRIRVDVPQEQIANARVGQSAKILSEARPGSPYRGEVLRIVQRADIQKVTLEVQVRVVDPDELLRPEMLCQVRFEAVAAEARDPKAGAEAVVFLIPKRLVEGDAVWIFDPEGPRAKRRRVELGATSRGEDGADWIEVLRGIDASDKLLDAPRGTLQDGTLVEVSGGA